MIGWDDEHIFGMRQNYNQIYIPDRISLTEWKVSTLLQMVYMGSFCSYNEVPNQAFW